MPPTPSAASTSNLSLSITNPLVLYRTLLATNRLKPDPAQHRLALQLQKLYFRLKDYRPEVEYRRRLERVTRGLASTKRTSSLTLQNGSQQGPRPTRAGTSPPRQPTNSSLWAALTNRQHTTPEMKALLPSTPLHDTALAINSPQGMLLYGEVGRGKSMLLDLLFNSLPSDRKRRWHFSTFMLDVFRRLEMERMARLEQSRRSSGSVLGAGLEHEHVVLSLARETVETSPVLFLDEFQMPDRASSRLVNSFLMGFFGLGGVLVASSNRMPEELSRGVGVKFVDSHYPGSGPGKWGRGGWVGNMFGQRQEERKRDETERFAEVLKARCEVWEMEGQTDWRRELDIDDAAEDGATTTADAVSAQEIEPSRAASPNTSDENIMKDGRHATSIDTIDTPPATTPATLPSSDSPPHYHLSTLDPASLAADINLLNPTAQWQPLSLSIYTRTLTFPQTYFPTPSTNLATTATAGGTLLSPFTPLLTTYLGPADYVSLASTFHSVILTDVPVLTSSTKNEARRLIWLIDALYEAGCRLVISAEAPVDGLFFPERRKKLRQDRGGVGRGGSSASEGERSERYLTGETLEGYESDSIDSEAMSEMYQDSTAPFRPNVSSYGGGGSEEWRSADPTFAPAVPNNNFHTLGASNKDDGFGGWKGRNRNILADEDADFGPTYGNGRGHGASASQEGLEDVLRRQGLSVGAAPGLDTVGAGPDFTDTRVLTGEDERFAYKRARSRLWEMCGRRWWRARTDHNIGEWWRPEGGQGLGGSERFWEGRLAENHAAAVEKVVQELQSEQAGSESTHDSEGSHHDETRRVDALRDAEDGLTGATGTSGTSGQNGEGLFRHGASPYRTIEEAPPKFGWQHAWGMMTWGKKAGEWGKGVEGDRIKEKGNGEVKGAGEGEK
ncbi:uncharacterized protein AB675_5657 [Cyphellophora attinorum]|uniref:Lactation elevated protein 1 n=1 Tax=Cyphellophora attinorum TaxID=1664694 RepID=A0A0N0NNU4_9EURO|nr:uncharacterized protein AB675_5657 [Phialophora attinorum]KPI41991.1 hypothetical protein AB675_5657 [Phialophora attinorum]